MVGLDQIGCVHVLWGNPFVVAFWEAFPFDQIAEHPILPKVLVIDNFFDLLFFFPINQVRWGLGEVGSMVGSLLVGREERRMKDIMNSLIVW
jgi:hypothetical protein